MSFFIFIQHILNSTIQGFSKRYFHYGNQPLISKLMNREVVKIGNIHDIYFGVSMLRSIRQFTNHVIYLHRFNVFVNQKHILNRQYFKYVYNILKDNINKQHCAFL